MGSNPISGTYEKRIYMFVKKIKSNKGIKEVGKYGIQKIDVDQETSIATLYSFGGNIFTVKCREILDDSKTVSNSRNAYKNLY